MRLKSIAFVMGLLLSLHATADYLFWQIGGTTTYNNDGTYTTSLGSSDSITYSYASIASLNSAPSPNPPTTAGTALNNQVAGLTGEYTKIDGEVAMLSTVAAVVDSSSFTEKYFFIELFDANNTLVGTSTAVKGSELQAFYSTAGFNAQWSGAKWNGGTYTAVPEPTSGLMLLIGAAMLGLRRKKVA